jgi:SWI/SNF-related matrix-associated actin-dependent regulator of chromatin subfamily A-like protein 1
MIKTTPYEFQLDGVRKMHHFNGRVLLADSMGMGKSLSALLFAHDTDLARPIVVVCPASLKWNWEREAINHIGMRSHILNGKTPAQGFRLHHPLIIVNYDILGEWLPLLKSLHPQIVIVDESARIANPKTKQTKNTKLLCKQVPYVICLSGTPLINRPAELFPTLNLLRPDLYPSFWAFASHHCHPELKPWGWQYKGAENLSELRRTLRRNLMIRRRKADVLAELPKKSRSIIPLEIDDRSDYNLAVKDFLHWLSKISQSKARKAHKAEKLVKLGYLKRLAARLKLRSVFEWIDNFLQESDEKLIVFGIHKFVLGALYSRYHKISVLVDGNVVGRDRQYAVDQFNTAKHKRLFLGNLKAAGLGWSCTSSSVVAFCEIGWTPGEHIQAEDRIHGIKRGQKDVRARAYYLVARETCEEDLCVLIQKKQKVLEGTLDGAGRGDQLNIFDQLAEVLKRKKKWQSNARFA